MNVLLGVDRASALEGLPVPEEAVNALAHYTGDLGQLLRFSESLDAGDFPEVAALSEELSIDLVDLSDHQRTAYVWVNQMI